MITRLKSKPSYLDNKSSLWKKALDQVKLKLDIEGNVLKRNLDGKHETTNLLLGETEA